MMTMKFCMIYHQINLSDKIIIINIQGQRKTVTVINTEEKIINKKSSSPFNSQDGIVNSPL